MIKLKTVRFAGHLIGSSKNSNLSDDEIEYDKVDRGNSSGVSNIICLKSSQRFKAALSIVAAFSIITLFTLISKQ